MPSKLHCPACNTEIGPRDSDHFKVSGIYAEGKIFGQAAGSNGVYAGYNLQSQLSQKLSPPEKHYDYGTDGYLNRWALVSMLVLSVIVIIYQGGAVILALILALVASPLFIKAIGIYLRTLKRVKVTKKRRDNNFPQVVGLWEAAYYCRKHDWVFDPTLRINIPAKDLKQHMGELIDSP